MKLAGNELAKRLVEILGISTKNVRAVTFRFAANEGVRVTIERWVEHDEAEHVVEVLKQGQLADPGIYEHSNH